MSTDDGIRLTDDEREALGGPDGPWIKDDWDDLLAAVESIVAARTAARLERVRALADEWSSVDAWGAGIHGQGVHFAAELRTALGEDA